jgi:formylglycine-generating enzyme required for sulfatase activity
VRVSLPTEQQWQRAAQGDDGRLYPWGRGFNHMLCNTSESRQRRPTPVTAYPGGASPMGAVDMAGNIEEWCLTRWGDGESDLSGDLARVLRGGSWKELAHNARCVARSADYPHNWYNHVGFRIVFALPVS